LLEHVSFIREPLDELLGNPDEINANTDQLKRAALEMHTIAQEHLQDISTVSEWSGDAADAYRASMKRLSEELDSMGFVMDGTAAVVGISGMLVCTMRAIVFSIISYFVGELIKGALIAAAAAVFSLGSSILAYIGYAGVRAGMKAAEIASKIAKLAAALGRQGKRLAELAKGMSRLADGLGRFNMAGGIAYGAYEAAKPYSAPAPGRAQ
jgi:uncharacterized protein YukE